MGRNNRPRSGLRHERTFYPEFGARHQVVDGDDIGFFFSDVNRLFEKILPSEVVIDEATGLPKVNVFGEERRRQFFRLYDHVDKTGVSILERRLPAEYARKHRIRWTKQDVGRIKGQIQDEIARHELAERRFPVTFTNVIRLGDADAESENARKIGLIVDQGSSEAEFLVREHAICVNGIQTSLRRFRYPYSTYIPHLTVGRIYRNVPLDTLNSTVNAVQSLLPLTVELDPIKFTLEQEI